MTCKILFCVILGLQVHLSQIPTFMTMFSIYLVSDTVDTFYSGSPIKSPYVLQNCWLYINVQKEHFQSCLCLCRVQKKFQPPSGSKIFIINLPLFRKSKLAKVLDFGACLEKLYGRRPMPFTVDVTTEKFAETGLLM